MGKVTKRKTKVVRTRNLGTWTEAEYFSRIRSALRKVFRYFKPMQKALDLASRPSKSANKKLKKEYQCAHCKKWFKRADVQIDHIVGAGSLRTYDDIVNHMVKERRVNTKCCRRLLSHLMPLFLKNN